MVRAEMRNILASIWCRPFAHLEKEGFVRQAKYEQNPDEPIDALSELDLFDNFADDEETHLEREMMARQYRDVYDSGDAASELGIQDANSDIEDQQDEVNLLEKQVYPFFDAQTEIDWILSHEQSGYDQEDSLCMSLALPQHLENFLD